jgi:hypothetical protein
MADDKNNVGGQDRSRVSASEPYEVEYFAQKHGIMPTTGARDHQGARTRPRGAR